MFSLCLSQKLFQETDSQVSQNVLIIIFFAFSQNTLCMCQVHKMDAQHREGKYHQTGLKVFNYRLFQGDANS